MGYEHIHQNGRHEDPRSLIERAWTEQLYREYDHILFHFRVHLRPPVIRIDSSDRRWGSWDQFSRTLTISRRLIERYPWDIVIEILKHEMAHQLAWEQIGGGSPHGPSFQLACDQLGVADWARAASGELPRSIPNWRERQLSEDEERLLKRAEKLLALAASSNEHEAALAMQRVRQLYAKYNLERLREKRATTHVYCILGGSRKRIAAEESMIVSILCEYFFVRAIYIDRYDASDLCSYKAVELLGTAENVLMAEYVYHFLRRSLESLWDSYKARTGAAARARRSYMLGVAAGFRDKLAKTAPFSEAEAQVGREQQAMVSRADHDLQIFVDHRHPRLAVRRTGGVRGDRDSFHAGVKDGGTITLHRGVSSPPEKRGLQLPR